MSYFDGFDYGYDQLFVNPTSDAYIDYSSSIVKPIKKEGNNPIANAAYEEEQNRTSMERLKYNNVYDYLEKHAQHTMSKSHTTEIQDLKRRISEFQQKNDMFLIFIICLVIYVILQYNNATAPQIHYITQSPGNYGSNMTSSPNSFTSNSVMAMPSAPASVSMPVASAPLA